MSTMPPPPPSGPQPPYAGPPLPDPMAPYGRHPLTGEPYGPTQKLIVGILQILVPLGIGRFMMGQTGLGVAQLVVTLVTCGIGGLWPMIDGIIILVNDDVRDAEGRLLRP